MKFKENKRIPSAKDARKGCLKVLTPTPDPRGIWHWGGKSWPCMKSSDPKTHPHVNFMNGESIDTLVKDYEDFKKSKNMTTYCLSVHVTADKDDPYNPEKNYVEYVLRCPSPGPIEGDNTGEAEMAGFQFVHAKRFTAKQQAYKESKVTIDVVANTDPVTFTTLNGLVTDFSNEVLFNTKFNAIGDGIRRMSINNGTVYQVPRDNVSYTINHEYTLDEFVATLDKLNISPFELISSEGMDGNVEVKAYVYVVEDDTIVTLRDGSLVPSLVKVDLSEDKQQQYDFDYWTRNLMKMENVAEVAGDNDYPASRGLGEDGRIYQPSVHPLFFGDMVEYEKMKFKKFALDVNMDAASDTEIFDSNGMFISKYALYNVDLSVTPGKVATPHHTTSSLAWEKCSVCGYKDGYGYNWVDKAWGQHQGFTDYGYAELSHVKSKYVGQMRVSAAYINGYLAKPVNSVLVGSSEDADTRTLNVEVIGRDISSTTMEYIRSKYVKGRKSDGYTINVHDYGTWKGREGSQQPVLSVNDLADPSVASQINTLWTQFMSSLSFLGGDEATFRDIIKITIDFNNKWRVKGIEWLLELLKDNDEFIQQMHDPNITVFDKLNIIGSSLENKKIYAALMSLFSYTIAAVTFYKLLTTIDFSVTSYDNVEQRMAVLFKDGAIGAMKDAFTSNIMASSLSELFGTMMEDYIAYEGYKFFPESGIVHEIDEMGSQGSTVLTEPNIFVSLLKGLGKFTAMLIKPVGYILTGLSKMIGYVLLGSWGNYRNMYHRAVRLSKDKWYMFALNSEEGFNNQDSKSETTPENNLAWSTYPKAYQFPTTAECSYVNEDGYSWKVDVNRNEGFYLQDVKYRNVILNWYCAVNPHCSEALLKWVEANELITAKGLLNYILSERRDEGLTTTNFYDENQGKFDVFYTEPANRWELYDNMCGQATTTEIGKYKFLFYDFSIITNDANEKYAKYKIENETSDIRECVGMNFNLDIGITANPKMVNDYGRWISEANLKSVCKDTWEYVSKMKSIINAFYDAKLDAIRTKYFNAADEYLTNIYIPALNARVIGAEVLEYGSMVTESEIIDIDPIKLENVDLDSEDLPDEIVRLKTYSALKTLNSKDRLRNINYCIPLGINNTRGLVTGGIKLAVGALMAVVGGVFTAITATNARMAQKKAKVTANVSYGVMLKDIKESYNLMNSIFEDNLLIMDGSFDVQRTMPTQVYTWVGDDFNAVEIARMGAYSSTAVAGLGLAVAGAVQVGKSNTLRKRAPDGSYTQKYKDKMKRKADKRAAKRLKKADKRMAKRLNQQMAAQDKYESSKIEAANAQQNYDRVMNDKMSSAAERKAASEKLASANAKVNESWNENIDASNDVTKASMKKDAVIKKNEKKASKLDSKLSSTLSAAAMNTAENAANPDNTMSLDMDEGRYASATFKAVTEITDKTDDLFAKLMDGQTAMMKTDDKLDLILKRLNRMAGNGLGASQPLSPIKIR